MKFRLLSGILLCGWLTAQAEFEQTGLSLHPQYPWIGPFILEIAGNWPNDCHPGEQKPVISSHDAGSVAITFEIIVEHVTCNAISTPFRVLVDMSSLAGTFTAPALHVDVEFGSSQGSWTVGLRCNPVVNEALCPGGRVRRTHVLPDAGLYFVPGMDRQGLLLARQNRSVAAYPLVYDDSGHAEWLYSGGVYVGDAYFGGLYKFSGGQCPGCPPPAAPVEMVPVGGLTMLFDSPHQVQVKFNDQPFVEYRPLSFGYGIVAQDDGGDGLVNLSGKWAVSWQLPAGDSVFQVVPQVFAVTQISSDDARPGTATYVAVDLLGAEVAEISCDAAVAVPCVWRTVPSPWDNGEGEEVPLTILSFRRIGYVLDEATGQQMAEAVRID